MKRPVYPYQKSPGRDDYRELIRRHMEEIALARSVRRRLLATRDEMYAEAVRQRAMDAGAAD